MSKRVLLWGGVLALVAAAAVWLLIAPQRLSASALAAGYKPDLANGAAMFEAGNCAGCHMTPGQGDRAQLGGGLKLTSPFGAFHVPNISPDKAQGIGDWTELEFVNAMKRGVGARGEHLYPAFPYTAYAMMRTSDVRDLFAYIRTVPASTARDAPHELKFPFNLRPVLGFWKLIAFRPAEFEPDPARSAAWNRGRYLVEAAAHCSECHTSRDAMGVLQKGKAYAGAPNLEAGARFASNITPHRDGIGDWSEQDIADFLKSGQDKCFNEPEGMREVIASVSKLSDPDVSAIGVYIHALPPIGGNADHKTC